MNIHYIQHVPFENLGYIEFLLKEKVHSITSTKVWENKQFPEIGEIDLLIILGGPIGVNDDNKYYWLKDEKKFINAFVKTKKKIIGICLGAQLLAHALGASIIKNAYIEIGWFPIIIKSSFSSWLGEELPQKELTVFHWHGDKFNIPPGAVNQAFSNGCDHQLFTYGNNIIGIQFHLEATSDLINSMIDNEGDEFIESRFIQGRIEILNKKDSFNDSNELMRKIFEKLSI